MCWPRSGCVSRCSLCSPALRKTPALSAVCAVVANIILNLTLIWFLGTGGLAAATAACSYLQVIILVTVLRRRLGRSILNGLSVTLKKTLAATALMCIAGATAMILMGSLPDNRFFDVLRLCVVVPLAAAVYVLAAKRLRIEMLSLLTGAKRR